VIIRGANPLPALIVHVATQLAPSNRSVAFVVVTTPLLVAELLPAAPTNTSTGLSVSMPLYSRILISG
jgi:hypothetical protein